MDILAGSDGYPRRLGWISSQARIWISSQARIQSASGKKVSVDWSQARATITYEYVIEPSAGIIGVKSIDTVVPLTLAPPESCTL
mgnify:CR=1 FL=1